MDFGAFKDGELIAQTLGKVPLASFVLAKRGVLFKASLISMPHPIQFIDVVVPMDGVSQFGVISLHGGTSQETGAYIKDRSLQATVDTIIVGEDPQLGDLGVGPDGLFVIAIQIQNTQDRRLVSLATGKELQGVGLYNYVWFRNWKLELVSSDGNRRSVVVDRMETT